MKSEIKNASRTQSILVTWYLRNMPCTTHDSATQQRLSMNLPMMVACEACSLLTNLEAGCKCLKNVLAIICM